MQCYQYLAAITAVSNIIENMPGIQRKMPYSVIADWMDENEIEAEDLLLVSGVEVRAIVESLIVRNQSQMTQAA